MNIKPQNIKLICLFFIVIVTIYQHVSSINNSMQNRDNIWEPDDNYHELIKASNSKNCVENECIGLDNIYKMYSENLNQNIKIKHSDILVHHTLVEYHPVKSFLLKKLYLYFDNWEYSHLFLTKIVTSLLVILIPFFILRYSNLDIALISSLILLPYVGIKYGFHFSHGSAELASVFAIISLICIKHFKLKNLILYFVFIVLSLLSHPAGVIMLLFNVSSFLFLSNFKLKKLYLIFYFFNFIILCIYFQLNFDYSQNKIFLTDIYNNYNYFNLYSLFNLILENIKNNLYFIYEINNLLNIVLIIFLLILFYKYYKIKNEYIKTSSVFLSITIFFILISLLHYAPQASIITRLQQIFTACILFFFSSIIFHFFKENYLLYLNKKLNLKNILFILFIILSFSFSTYFNYQHLNLKVKSNQETLNVNLDTSKIKEFLQTLSKEDIVIFDRKNVDNSTFNSILYKFILEGANNKNIFIDELMTLSLYKKILNKESYNSLYLVSTSPMITNNLVYKEKRPNCFSLSDFRKCIARGWYGKSRTYMSDLLIKNKSKLKFNQKSFRNKYLFLYINSFNQKVKIKSEDYNIEFKTKNEYEWIKINYEEIKNNTIQFILDDNTFIKLNGIKFQKNYKNHWPWGTDIEIIYSKDKYTRNFKFQNTNHLNFLNCIDSKIIDDKGSYLITKLNCKIK